MSEKIHNGQKEPNPPNVLDLLTLPSLASLSNINNDRSYSGNPIVSRNRASESSNTVIDAPKAPSPISQKIAAERKTYSEDFDFLKQHIEVIEKKLIEVSAQNKHSYESLIEYLKSELPQQQSKVDKTQKLFIAGIKSVLEKIEANSKIVMTENLTKSPKSNWKRMVDPHLLGYINLGIVTITLIYLLLTK